MELDSLKTLWKEQGPPGDEWEQADLLAMLEKRSRGPIHRMRRNLRVETIMLIATYIPTILLYIFLFQGTLWAISVIMAVILVIFLVYFYLKNRLLKKMQCVTCEVRSNLARQVEVLGKYIRFYYWSATLSLVIGWVIAYEVIIYAKHEVHPHLVFNWWFQPAFLLALLIPFGVGGYFLNRRRANKLYGRHIKKLKELLQEMDEV